jgi:hypothetical protein
MPAVPRAVVSVLAPDGWNPAHRARLERIALRAAERSVAGASLALQTSERESSGIAPPQVSRREIRERLDAARLRSDRARYALPSYDKGGAQREIDVEGPASEGAVLGSASGDTIYGDPFESLPVIRQIANRYLWAGGSPWVESGSLTRAIQWGRVFFGGVGFVIIENKNALGSFFTVGLRARTTVADLGGLGERDIEAARAEFRRLSRESEFLDFVDYLIVGLVTADETPIVSSDPTARWSARRFEEALSKSWSERRVSPEEAQAVTTTLLGGAGDAADAARRRFLVQMDRTVFAVVPWEERARYLRLLIRGWTSEAEELAIIEILAATTNANELNAIFALLRQWKLHRALFNDLSPGRAFEALQILGELRGGGHIDFDYFVSLWLEVLPLSISSIALDPERLLEEPGRVYEGLLDWVAGTVEGVWYLLSEPDQLIRALPAIFEFALLLARAQAGDPQALATIGSLLLRASEALVKAVRGAEYVEELGVPFSDREETGARVAGDLVGRVRYALVLEVVSWFVGIGEVKAAYESVRSGKALERVGAVLGRLGKAGKAVRAAEIAVDAAKLERTVNALRALSGIADEARVASLLEHLTQDQLVKLARVAERANLPEGAGADALRLALAADKELAGAADDLAGALTLIARVEEKVGGKIGPETAQGLRNLLEHAPWTHEEALRVISEVPAGSADEFMRALRYVSPDHLSRWGPAAFETIAKRPVSLRFLADAGGDTFEAVYTTGGRSWERFERIVEGVNLRKAEINDPAEYQRLLDRLRNADASAFEEAAGARLRTFTKQGPSPEATKLIGDAVGDGGEALRELTVAEQRTALLAADLAPELTRRAVAAEIEGSLARTLDELDAVLFSAGMGQAEIDATKDVLTKLNDPHRALRFRKEIEVGLARAEGAGDPRELGRKVDEYLQELAKSHKELLAAGKTNRARVIERRMQRLRDLRSGKFSGGSVKDFEDAVRSSRLLWEHTQIGNADMLRRLWLQYWSRQRPPKVGFEEYVAIISRHFRGNFGEYEVAFRLGETHILLKAPDRLVTLPGTDLVAIARGGDEVLLLDNKAFLGLPEIDNVNALTRNLPKNINSDLAEFAKLAGRNDLPAEFQKAVGKLQAARDEITQTLGTVTRKQLEDPKTQAQIDGILRKHGVRRVVTNAGGEVQGLSNELLMIGLELLDLNL